MSLNALSDDLIRPAAARATTAVTSSDSSKAIDALAKFIPTEMLAPYVGALSLIATNQVTWKGETVYLGFVLITPLAFLLFHFAKIAMDPNQSWPGKKDIPLLIWRVIAATAAFAVWALAVPTSDLQAAVGGAAVATFLAIVVSPVLTALDAIINRLFA